MASRGQARQSNASPTARAPSQARPRGNDPWLLTHSHTTGISSHWLRRLSTIVTVSTMQMAPKSRGRGVQNGVPSPTTMSPPKAVRSGDPARTRRTTSHTSRAMSRACSRTTSRKPPRRSAQP